MRRLIVLRGLPGSGKSHWAKRNLLGALICSADDYFVDKATGEYRYDPKKIAQAHTECRLKAFRAMSGEYPPDTVVIDNTNMQRWEVQEYFAYAAAFEYQAQAVLFTASVDTCLRRNVHGVPIVALQAMMTRFEHTIGVPQEVVNTEGAG